MRCFSYCVSLFLLLFVSCVNVSNQKDTSLSGLSYVNTLIGTNSNRAFSHGNTYPAVTQPWGMNAWTPQTGLMDDPWVYTYQSDSIRGFKQTHVPSPWIGDYGAFSIMPVTGSLKTKDTERSSCFYHSDEFATPYYYKVHLADYNVDAELTATERCGYLRFSFNDNKDRFLILDAFNQGGHVKIIPEERKIVGFCKNNTGGVPSNFANYFVMVFDSEFSDCGVWDKDGVYEQKKELESSYIGSYLRFENSCNRVSVKVASSYISVEQAELTLKREIGDLDFMQVKEKSRLVWADLMGRINVEGGTEEQKKTFYSNLYRVSLYPRQFYEYDEKGEAVYFSPYDGQVHKGVMFSDNGFWDTFRSAHPFYTLLFPELTGKLMQALINIYEEGGWLPNWISPGYRNSMIGAHAVSLISDAYVKGIRDFDAQKALEAVRKECSMDAPQSFMGRYGWENYNKLGYVPYPKYPQAVSMTLEYAYDDYCIATMAKKMGKKEIADEFYKRAQNYRNVYNPATSFMQPRDEKGNFAANFSPDDYTEDICESNGWQYFWSVPQDLDGLVGLVGSKERFAEKLDSMFTYVPKSTEDLPIFSTGMIGQYAHGNEPSHHVIYLYNKVGQPWKTQKYVAEVLHNLYQNAPDGICGNEDCGQMSAWFVFSSMGFYPVDPISGKYEIGTPIFPEVKMHLANGKTFVVLAPAVSRENIYVQSVKLNGRPYDKSYITHEQIMNGDTLEFEMGNRPGPVWYNNM